MQYLLNQVSRFKITKRLKSTGIYIGAVELRSRREIFDYAHLFLSADTAQICIDQHSHVAVKNI